MIVVGLLVSGILMVNLNFAGLDFNSSKNLSYPASQVKSLGLIMAVAGICPQNRKTRTASSSYLRKQSPFPSTSHSVQAGKRLYQKDAKPIACRLCHGIKGNGNGRLAVNMEPQPRNFSCSKVMKTLPDGQLFWIIKNGSKGTKMPAHKLTLSDREIWELIHYLRKFVD